MQHIKYEGLALHLKEYSRVIIEQHMLEFC